ncbi:hypothetical protein [Bradyrhizobium sp. SEMIA]|uniref:hypothetical protein n=1 Tax=Bradyrhizobium sp. SEMIA TaxID=2597515 RepID=UPI0018A41DEF|nr:hypothetical protein [Bradyrhizobium sp. SEMIA]QOG21759.1 hypothetical protein FOM02_35170 [Bradyrhizobium sp. SEMIA]
MRSDTSQLVGRRILVAGDGFVRADIESYLEMLECTVVGSTDSSDSLLDVATAGPLDAGVIVVSDSKPDRAVIATAEQLVCRGVPTFVHHTGSIYTRPYVPELMGLPIIEWPYTTNLRDMVLRALSERSNTNMTEVPRMGFVTKEGDRRFDISIHKIGFSTNASERIFRLGLSSHSSLHEVLEWVEKNKLQLLVFPLTLPNFIALQIGEHARRPEATFKTVLVSGSSLLKMLNGFALYHSTASPAEFERDTIAAAMSNNSTMTAKAVVECVEDILKNDPSFAKLTNCITEHKPSKNGA